jgi:hypothetical protein
MSASLSTFSKLETLLRTTNLTPTRFSALCKLCNIGGMSDASLNRSIQRRDFSNEVDLTVRELLLKLENLIARADPFPVNFENVENINFLLDVIAAGIELTVATIQRTTNSTTKEVTDDSADNPLVERSGI